jgi:lipoprotein Spr/probable lipoprotein NlpC
VVVHSSGKEPISATVAERRKLLLAHYQEWKGVRYRSGGMDKNGVDCSGFVYLTYRRFGKVLPRTVKKMAEAGRGIDETLLEPGDLVLFKTGWFEHHAGIYMGKRNFLHVSSRKGVIISSIDDYYWKDRLWKSRRIF